jgi:hypothetical protein
MQFMREFEHGDGSWWLRKDVYRISAGVEPPIFDQTHSWSVVADLLQHLTEYHLSTVVQLKRENDIAQPAHRRLRGLSVEGSRQEERALSNLRQRRTWRVRDAGATEPHGSQHRMIRKHGLTIGSFAALAAALVVVALISRTDRLTTDDARAAIGKAMPSARIEDGPDVSHAKTLVVHVAGDGTVADVLVVVGDGDQNQGVAALRSAKRKLGGRWEGSIGCASWWVDDRQIRGKDAYDMRLRVEAAVKRAAPHGEDCQG